MTDFFKRYQIAIYLILVLIISWIPFIGGNGTMLTMTPSLLAIIFAFGINGREGGMDLLRRATRWRAKVQWWLIAFFGTAVLFALGLALHLALGGRPPTLTALREETTLLPLYLLIVFLPIYGPLGEELGWRGYLQKHLQNWRGPLIASLIIGTYWGVWHLPDFLVPDTTQYSLGMVFFIPYILGTIANSLIMTWLYNKTGGSTLIGGIIWHAGTDFWGPVLLSDLSLRAAQAGETNPPLDAMLYGLGLVALIVAGLVVVIATRGKLGMGKGDAAE